MLTSFSFYFHLALLHLVQFATHSVVSSHTWFICIVSRHQFLLFLVNFDIIVKCWCQKGVNNYNVSLDLENWKIVSCKFSCTILTNTVVLRLEWHDVCDWMFVRNENGE